MVLDGTLQGSSLEVPSANRVSKNYDYDITKQQQQETPSKRYKKLRCSMQNQ